ncbi:MAG TPA: hypothetical protein DCE41_15670 [Cytophagales bacterium]|nr:hypothetical protein [Cytophagales bacterium]HAA18917.1 hypothetical protein [Cytophagales bacterium]HAP63574.1 hypothetical protein [Cytophagales bacterium]
MIEKMILGLLFKKDMTVYDIKVAMDKSISMFYSNSFGSINPAMKKLEKQGLITCSEQVEKSRLKKIYRISPPGKEAYTAWVTEPIQEGRLKESALARMFFLGDAGKEEQKHILLEYCGVILESRKELTDRKQEIEAMNLSQEDQEEIKFQLATLQFGIDYMEFKRKWFQKLSNEL